KFNPFVLASSTKIEIFPHQIDALMTLLERPRMMLADEVGLGKTIVAALVAAELSARGLAKRLLFVVPKALVTKWIDELRERFEIDAQHLNSELTRALGTPFSRDSFCYVSSMDYLKQEHVRPLIAKAGQIDLVVVDEAHKLAKGTERFQLGKVLAEKANHMIFLTATPHNGDDEDYVERMRLLDHYVHDPASASHLLIRNLKEDVIDLEGREVFPPRHSKTVEVPLSPDELRISEMVDEYVSWLMSMARDRREMSAMRMLGTVLRKRASSSLYALKRSLERRIGKLGSGVDIYAAFRRLREAEEEFDEEEYERAEEEIISATVARVDEERRRIEQILQAIEALGGRDSKLERLKKVIGEIKRSDPKAKVIVFSEYRDTLDYLQEALSSEYRIARIDGTMSVELRRQQLESFKSPDGPDIMICTDAAGEGIDMQFSNVEINYDIPWNPTRLEQRMGRIHRIGQTREVFYYNFVLKDTIDGYILSILLEKIEQIKKALGERVYDVIGRLIGEERIAELYEELLRVPKAEWAAKIRAMEEEIERNRRRYLEEIERLLTGNRFDRTKLEEYRKLKLYSVDIGEVKRFVEVYLGSKDGKVIEVDREAEVFRLYLPRRIAEEVGRGFVDGSFSPRVAQSRSLPYLALGNRVVNLMLRDAARPVVSSFKHPTLNGLLAFFLTVFRDGYGQPRDGKVLAFLISRDGSVSEVDPRIVWDLERDLQRDELPGQDVRSSLDSVKGVLEERKQELIKRVEERLRKHVEISRNIVITYYSNKMDEIERLISEYEQKVAESPHYNRLLEQKRANLQSLRSEMMKRLEELNALLSVSVDVELIGLASVRAINRGDELEAKLLVERAGIKAVLEYEEKRAGTDEKKKAKIRDVSREYRGYDVESFDRVIEVKAFVTTGPVEMTSHEWETAKRMGEYYWLYVVKNALTKPEVVPIQDPVRKFEQKVRREAVIDYKYVIDDWEPS
ncbi:MAG: helicase-related protein, partial [Nitrososphaerota archaeon]